MRVAIFVLSVSVSFLSLLPAHAQPRGDWQSADQSAIHQRIAAGEAASVLAWLTAQASEHLHDAQFNYTLGLAAAAADKKPLAIDAFERAVLIDPRFAAAWLELALLVAHFGDTQTALNIFDHVLTQFDPPSEVRKKINRLSRALLFSERAQRASSWQAEIYVGAGVVTNVNAGLTNLNFLLYLPSTDPLPVRANDALKPRSDTAMMFRALAVHAQPLNTGFSSQTILTLGARHYSTERDYRQAELGLWWQLERKLSEGTSWRIRPGLRVAEQDARSQVAAASLMYGFSRQLARDCQSTLFMEPEWREVAGAGVGSQTLWVGAQAGCEAGIGQLSGYVRAGSDRPQAERAGGDTHRVEAQASWRQRFTVAGGPYEAGALFFGARYADREPYSALLGENTRRVVQRRVFRVGLDREIGSLKNTKVSVYYQINEDRSESSLFSTRGQEVFFGLKRGVGW